MALIGYENYKDESGFAMVRIDPIKGPLVKRVLEEYPTGQYSLGRLVPFANKIGLTTRNNTPITKKTLDNMIHNTFYYGVMRTIDVFRPHTCGNIISKDLYDKNQEIITGNSTRQSFTKQSDTFLFNGLLRCTTCGCTITPERHTKKNGKSYTYLRCYHHTDDCHQELVNEDIILKQVKEEIFDKLKIDKKMLELIKAEVRKNIEKEHEQTLLLKSQTEKKLEELNFQKNRCIDLLIDKTIDKQAYDMKISEIANIEANLKQKITTYNIKNSEINQIVNSVIDFAVNMGKYFISSDFSLKKQILQILISNSFLNGKSVVFSITKPSDFMLKHTEGVVWWVMGDPNPRPTD